MMPRRGDIVKSIRGNTLLKILQVVGTPLFGEKTSRNLIVLRQLDEQNYPQFTVNLQEFTERYEHIELTDLEKLIYDYRIR